MAKKDSKKATPQKKSSDQMEPAFSGDNAWNKVLNNTHTVKEGQLPDRAAVLFDNDDLEILRGALEDLEWKDGKLPCVEREFLNAGLMKPVQMNCAPDFIAAAIRIAGELKDMLEAGWYFEKFHSVAVIRSLQHLTVQDANEKLVESYLTVIPLMAKNHLEFQRAVRESNLFEQLKQRLTTLKAENRATNNIKYKLVNAIGSCLHGTELEFWKAQPEVFASPVRAMACDLPIEGVKGVLDAVYFLLERFEKRKADKEKLLTEELHSDLLHLYCKLRWCHKKFTPNDAPYANIQNMIDSTEKLLLESDPEKLKEKMDKEALYDLHMCCADRNRAYYEQDLRAYESFRDMLIRLKESKLADHKKYEEEVNQRKIDRKIQRKMERAGNIKVEELSQDQPGPSGTTTTQKKNLSPVSETDVQDSPREDPEAAPPRPSLCSSGSSNYVPDEHDASPVKTPQSPVACEVVAPKEKPVLPSLPPKLPMIMDPVGSHFKVVQVYSSDEYLELMINEGKVKLPPSPPERPIEEDDCSATSTERNVSSASASDGGESAALLDGGESAAAPLVDNPKKGFFSKLFKKK
ncbi:hypothetical protein CAEBREN_14832 [Caenorhabditis brenneri]|uniref:Uncharacterized protein n=1 Tax=Caenorhabditis brenneri TaxID=135651 RepID=G0MCT2_CAEBE|nr:hypothetical protein CAEBREN_14832 [Caenorhabditis brenneri]